MAATGCRSCCGCVTHKCQISQTHFILSKSELLHVSRHWLIRDSLAVSTVRIEIRVSCFALLVLLHRTVKNGLNFFKQQQNHQLIRSELFVCNCPYISKCQTPC